MATATVSRSDYEGGRLPAICTETGEQSDHMVEYTSAVEEHPHWTGMWALFGVFGAIANIFANQNRATITGQLPYAAGVYEAKQKRARDARNRAYALAAVVWLAIALVFWFTTDSQVVGIFFGAGVGAVVASLQLRPNNPRISVDDAASTVTIDGIHQNLADAVARGERHHDS